MLDKEAQEIVKALRDDTIAETVSLHGRIAEVKKDQEEDPHDLNVTQIARLEGRLAKKVKQAEALTIIVDSFAAPEATDKIARIPLVEIHRGDPIANVQIKLFNKADQQIAAIDAPPEEVQELAVRILTQTTYSFTDTAKALEDAQFRLDGLDK